MAYNTAILTVFIAIFTVGFRAEQQCGDAEGEYYSFKINSNHLEKSKLFFLIILIYRLTYNQKLLKYRWRSATRRQSIRA